MKQKIKIIAMILMLVMVLSSVLVACKDDECTHEWSAWALNGDGTKEVRTCGKCQATEERPATTTPTEDVTPAVSKDLSGISIVVNKLNLSIDQEYVINTLDSTGKIIDTEKATRDIAKIDLTLGEMMLSVKDDVVSGKFAANAKGKIWQYDSDKEEYLPVDTVAGIKGVVNNGKLHMIMTEDGETEYSYHNFANMLKGVELPPQMMMAMQFVEMIPTIVAWVESDLLPACGLSAEDIEEASVNAYDAMFELAYTKNEDGTYSLNYDKVASLIEDLYKYNVGELIAKYLGEDVVASLEKGLENVINYKFSTLVTYLETQGVDFDKVFAALDKLVQTLSGMPDLTLDAMLDEEPGFVKAMFDEFKVSTLTVGDVLIGMMNEEKCLEYVESAQAGYCATCGYTEAEHVPVTKDEVIADIKAAFGELKGLNVFARILYEVQEGGANPEVTTKDLYDDALESLEMFKEMFNVTLKVNKDGIITSAVVDFKLKDAQVNHDYTGVGHPNEDDLVEEHHTWTYADIDAQIEIVFGDYTAKADYSKVVEDVEKNTVGKLDQIFTKLGYTVVGNNYVKTISATNWNEDVYNEYEEYLPVRGSYPNSNAYFDYDYLNENTKLAVTETIAKGDISIIMTDNFDTGKGVHYDVTAVVEYKFVGNVYGETYEEATGEPMFDTIPMNETEIAVEDYYAAISAEAEK